MTGRTIEQRFQDAMISIYERGKKETGYNATRFLQMIQDKGGVETAKELLSGDPTAVSDGFTNLALKGRLDLSVEALVQEPEWRSLFSSKELSVANRQLR